MSEVDLSRLLGGKSFTTLCTLFRNGYGVITNALADSGANAFALLDTKCAEKTSEFLNTPLETLERPVPVKGYNGKPGKPIMSILRLHLRVDGRRQYNVPFLVTDLGHHDVILGRKWLAYLDLWLDVRHRQLIWPTSLPPTPSFIKEVTITMRNLLRTTTTTDLAHQADATRRDQAFQEDICSGKVPDLEANAATVLDNCSYQDLSVAAIYEATAPLATDQETLAPSVTDHRIAIKIAIKPKSTTHKARDITRHSEHIDRQDSLRKMERELQGRPAATPIPTRKTKTDLLVFPLSTSTVSVLKASAGL